MKRRAAILGVSLTLLATVLAQDGPETVIRGSKQFRRAVIASGLAGPWEVTWGPDNMLWVTERTGKRVTRINPASGEKLVVVTIDEVSAPGSQDGLLGMALHPDLLKGKGADYVYVAYTYTDEKLPADPTVPDPKNPYRYLYTKIVRYTYDASGGKLTNPMNVLAALPAGNDHVAGRLKFGPDRKLYLTIGDQGNNQLGNVCLVIESQRLPSRAEIGAKNYAAYVGKSLRINLDGSIPGDNPKLNGVVSHVYTYGHRNPQGIDFGPDGTLYESEQGPKTDDEVNILRKGANYGWPHVAGLKDDKAYEFARWAEAKTPCAQLTFSDLAIHPTVPREAETSFQKPFLNPLATMFTVPTGFNFSDPVCKGVDFICWPTTGVSSIEYYESKGKGIPGWDKVVMMTTLKRGSLYIQPLKANGKEAAGDMHRYFQSENRYRDTAVSGDLRTIYVATDPGGLTEAIGGGTTRRMQDQGAILAFTYESEGTGAPIEPRAVSDAGQPGSNAPATAAIGGAPQFTAAQSAAGKTAYNASCAVCHGSTLTNGTFGTPLGGEYFKTHWTGRTVRAFYDKAQKTMPPPMPGSLTADTYAGIVAYVLEMNGYKAGAVALPSGGDALDKMVIK